MLDGFNVGNWNVGLRCLEGEELDNGFFSHAKIFYHITSNV